MLPTSVDAGQHLRHSFVSFFGDILPPLPELILKANNGPVPAEVDRMLNDCRFRGAFPHERVPKSSGRPRSVQDWPPALEMINSSRCSYPYIGSAIRPVSASAPVVLLPL